MSDIELYVDGVIYTGWKSASVSNSIEQAASTFSIALSSNVNGDISILPVLPGTPCKLVLQGITVITGYVDGISGKYDSGTHQYDLVGRSKIGDLVDCSAVLKGGEFSNQTVSQIAKALCEPFAITVDLQADEGAPLKKHRTEDASVHEVIERACRRRGLLLTSSPDGELIICEVGKEKIDTPIIKGQNVKGASGTFTYNDRFSEYRVKGQADDGGAGWELSQQVQAKGVAKDPGILRYRPLVVDAEDGETDLTKRALFEASTRLGRSTKITYTLQGWQHSSGLWEINKQVRVIDTYFGTDAWFLISAVTFKLDQSGTLAEVTVIPIEAFTVEPLKVKAEDKAQGKSTGAEKNKKTKGGGYGDVFN